MAISFNSSFVVCHSPFPCGAPRRMAGFTLIELLSVMAVMVMISTIFVSSGFGMRRGAAYNAASQIPNNVFEYARQRACLDGRKTAVLFKNETGSDTEPSYVASIFQAAGTVDGIDSGSNSGIIDKFTDIATNTVALATLEAFNFKTGKTFGVKSIRRRGESANFESVKLAHDDAADGSMRYYYYPRTVIEARSGFSSADWHSGDAYGFEVADRQTLPKNFKYTPSSGCKTIDNKSFFCVFNPDGTIGENGAGSITIQVKETVGKGRTLPNISFP